MSQARGSRRVKRKRHRCENKSTQTELERSPNATPTINGSVILKVTDYTKPEEHDYTSGGETTVSDDTSHCSSTSGTPKNATNNTVKITETANQTNDGWRNSIVPVDESSDSDDFERRNAQSYDFLEGVRMVTSLGDLVLSDSEEEPQQRRLTLTTSNEEKLAKFL